MPRVIHFEIQSSQPEESSAFYSSVFGWGVNKKVNQDYWLVHTGVQDQRGINGGMTKAKKGQDKVVFTVDVPSVDTYLTKVTEHGGKILKAKFGLPGTGYVAYCADPNGVVFAILQYDPEAK